MEMGEDRRGGLMVVKMAASPHPGPPLRRGEQLVDFAYRSQHETAITAKAIVQAFYGKPAARWYFVGCWMNTDIYVQLVDRGEPVPLTADPRPGVQPIVVARRAPHCVLPSDGGHQYVAGQR